MSWYYYDDARQQKERLLAKIESRRKKGEKFERVEPPAGKRAIATTFWGQTWCKHLESYADYETRLPRGRSYLRAGNVYNVGIDRGVVTAQVAGSSLYDVRIQIQSLNGLTWKALKRSCAGQAGSLLDLLSGRLGPEVMRAVTDRQDGLFPAPKEISLSCSCPDWADLCKHAASVLYAVAIMFDRDPRLFFALRGVDPAELIESSAAVLTSPVAGGGDDLGDTDLSALFGIDLGDATGGLRASEDPATSKPASNTPAPPPQKKAAAVPKKPSAKKKTTRAKSSKS